MKQVGKTHITILKLIKSILRFFQAITYYPLLQILAISSPINH